MIIPSKKQYINLIKYGDDSIDKKILLNTDGTFELISNEDFNFDLDYVGRSETLDAWNDYVGIGASKDVEYINNSYTMFLKSWLKYIENGTKHQYLDLYGPEKEEEIINKIKKVYEIQNQNKC